MRRLRHDDGVAAVEFALVIPIVIAIIAFGMSMLLGLSRQSELQRVAEISARAVSVPSGVSAGGRSFRTTAQVEQAVRDTTTGGFDTLEIRDADGTALDLAAIPEGQPFEVEVTVVWRNPLARLVNLVGLGITGEANTIVARAVGLRE